MTDDAYEKSSSSVGFIHGRYVHDMRGSALEQVPGTHVADRRPRFPGLPEFPRSDWFAGIVRVPVIAEALVNDHPFTEFADVLASELAQGYRDVSARLLGVD